MKLAHHRPARARRPRSAIATAALVTLLSAGLVLPLSGAQAASAVPLGTAGSFAILAGSTITNTGASSVTGGIGLHPGTDVPGYGPGANAITHNGALHVANGVALQAKADLVTGYTNAAGQLPVTEIPTELGGTTLTAGAYNSAAGTFGVTDTLTLDGQGDPGSVFVFQMGSTLTTASASSVSLINGANLCNVYWQVGSSATLGTNSTFRGTIMADQSITLTTGATLQGRVLAREGAVTLDTNVISNAACSTPTVDDDEPEDDDDTPVDDTPVDDTPVDDTPVDDTPVDDTPVDDDTPVVDGIPVPDDTPSDGDTPPEDDASGERGAPTDGSTPAAGGTPTDDDTPTARTTGTGSGTPGEATTTGQVREVPGGSVAAGGGMDAGPERSLLATGALALVALGGTAGIAARRRGRV